MDVETALDEAIEGSFDRRRREEVNRRTGSCRRDYEKSLRSVDRLVGEGGVLALAEWITDQIRAEERLPSSREVRSRGADICRENGIEIPSDSWLGT